MRRGGFVYCMNRLVGQLPKSPNGIVAIIEDLRKESNLYLCTHPRDWTLVSCQWRTKSRAAEVIRQYLLCSGILALLYYLIALGGIIGGDSELRKVCTFASPQPY